MKLLIRPQAKQEMRDAARWYESQGRGLGDDFMRALDAALAYVARFPLASGLVSGDIRRTLLRKYPYALFHTVLQDSIIVLGCIHQHRDPRSWPH